MQLILAINVDLDKNEKWKIHLYPPFLVTSQKKWKFSFFCDLESGSKAIGYHMAFFHLDLWLEILITNAHGIKCEKKMSWPTKLLDLVV
jgi:hypothetical protein